MNFFVAGTDTDVGKSYVCRYLAKAFAKNGKKVSYLKPFQSGIEENIDSDALQVKKTSEDVITKSTYITKTPATPLISSEIDGVEYDLEVVKKDYLELSKNSDITIVEGSGGLYVPTKKDVLMIDVIKYLNLPTLLVARPNLGTINHTLMSIECLKNKGIEILGIVISNYPNQTKDPVILRAKEMIESFCNIKVLDIIYQGQTDFTKLASILS